MDEGINVSNDCAKTGCASSAEATSLHTASEQAGQAQSNDGIMRDSGSVLESECNGQVSLVSSGDAALASHKSRVDTCNINFPIRASFARAPDVNDGVCTPRLAVAVKPVLVEVPRFQET